MDALDRLKEIDCPTLVIVGEDGPEVDVGHFGEADAGGLEDGHVERGAVGRGGIALNRSGAAARSPLFWPDQRNGCHADRVAA